MRILLLHVQYKGLLLHSIWIYWSPYWFPFFYLINFSSHLHFLLSHPLDLIWSLFSNSTIRNLRCSVLKFPSKYSFWYIPHIVMYIFIFIYFIFSLILPLFFLFSTFGLFRSILFSFLIFENFPDFSFFIVFWGIPL